MNGFAKIERDRAFARVIEHLRAAHAHLNYAAHENTAFGLGLALPDQKLLRDAIDQCAHAFRQQEPRK